MFSPKLSNINKGDNSANGGGMEMKTEVQSMDDRT
jgi:hypothetical protein